jgi:hypothetical protein
MSGPVPAVSSSLPTCRRGMISAAWPGWRSILGLAAPAAASLASTRFLVHGRPGTPLGFAFRDAAVLITFFDMFGLSFLLIGVSGFVAARP